MGIELDLQNQEHLDLIRLFGPYSIHCEVFVEGLASPSITAHDSGWSLSFLGDAELAAKVAQGAGVDAATLYR